MRQIGILFILSQLKDLLSFHWQQAMWRFSWTGSGVLQAETVSDLALPTDNSSAIDSQDSTTASHGNSLHLG
jgi:hypothetical protein